jgi:prefoldin subunit 5
MEPKTQQFIENVDAWIKQIRSEFGEITDVSQIVEENTDNIQHNYELLHELRDEIDSLKKELEALKLLQLLNIKEKLATKN